MISVCMASYNGSAYIEQQLKSILSQLQSDDEIVLVDDHSTDTTLTVVDSLNDARVKVYPNTSNEGVLKTFERAIRIAAGDIIFLSDQDDVWYPRKVAEMVAIFDEYPDVTLALSDAEIIDADGVVSSTSFFQRRGRFSSGVLSNITKNKYLGCTMGFRRSLVPKILPFPADIPMHDMWIGCINAIYGRVHFLDMPLMGYRRHDKNASPGERQSLLRMFFWRWKLVKNLGARVLSRALLFK